MYTSATNHRPYRARPEKGQPAITGADTAYSKRCRKALWKLAAIWLSAAALAFAIDKVYALFAHGVGSPHMELLFLYPLLGGALVYGLLALFAPGVPLRRFWRPGLNLYNSGQAAISAGSLLQGIFEIAGTASAYTALFFLAGILLALCGVILAVLPHRRGTA